MSPFNGLYRGENHLYKLDLRLEIDNGNGSLVSGDVFRVTGSTQTWSASFRSTTLTRTGNDILAKVDFSRYSQNEFVAYNMTDLAIELESSPAKTAKVELKSEQSARVQTFTCAWIDKYFRELTLISQVESGIVYANQIQLSAAQPNNGESRTVSVKSIFESIGYRVEFSSLPDIPKDTTDGAWDETELSSLMKNSLGAARAIDPGWYVWTFFARKHPDPAVRGTMFDISKRRGCAVFIGSIGSDTPEKIRQQIFTQVHEIAHCLNLRHTDEVNGDNPCFMTRVGASMESDSFWRSFQFEFNAQNTTQLKHEFLSRILMGKDQVPFEGVPRLVDARPSIPIVLNNPAKRDLQLSLSANPSFALGEPVSIELKLSSLVEQKRFFVPDLHPRFGQTNIVIEDSKGNSKVFRPLTKTCLDSDSASKVLLFRGAPSIRNSVYIGYDAGGTCFENPGHYKVWAAYQLDDGTQLFSNVVPIRIRYPRGTVEEDFADAYSGEQQGEIFYFEGSDCELLRKGNRVLQSVIDKHPNDPLSSYARIAIALNLSNQFKSISKDTGKLAVREPDFKESIKLLKSIIDTSDHQTINNLTLERVIARLIYCLAKTGDHEQAKATVLLARKCFEPRVRKPTINRIEASLLKNYEGFVSRNAYSNSEEK